MLRSMTGFGRYLVENKAFSQQWEIRSVNGRHLDIKWRLPAIVRYLEPALEKVVRRHATRGRIDIFLALDFAPGKAPEPGFNTQLAMMMLEKIGALAQARGNEFIPDYSSLLALPQLWTEPELEADAGLAMELEGGLALAMQDWNESRITEGSALGRDLQARILKMEEWTELIDDRAPELKVEKIRLLRERLADSLSQSGLDLDESRFLQEIVILTDKVDVSEELTRLAAHLERMRQLLAQGQDAGRKLDFTLQECFREINTCGNKLQDAQLSAIIVDLKNELEKCREQAQNLE